MSDDAFTHVTFWNINDQAKKELLRLFLTQDAFELIEDAYLWADSSDVSMDTKTPRLSLESSWGPPVEGLSKFVSNLASFDNNIIISATYDIEGFQCVGFMTYQGSEEKCKWELHTEDIKEVIIKKDPKMAEHWDEERGFWKFYKDEQTSEEDEAEDTCYEIIEAHIDGLVQRSIAEMTVPGSPELSPT